MDKIAGFLSSWEHLFNDETVLIIAENHQTIIGGLGLLVAILVLFVQLQFLSLRLVSTKKAEPKLCNYKIRKDQPKVVDKVSVPDMEDIAQFKDGKLVMCRCWKSESFPYCDGSHVKHNQECGDNCGPLIIEKPK